MRRDMDIHPCNGLKSDDVKIMAQASVFLQGEPASAVEIRHGMKLTSVDGRDAGRVAGVAVSQDGHQVLCIILSHLPGEAGYQCLPVSWIKHMEGEVIVLNACLEMILTLPGWHSI